MGLKGMVLSAIAVVAGAIMYWAVTAQNSGVVQNHGFRLSTVGVILMIAGGVGFVVSLVVFSMANHNAPPPSQTLDRSTTDSSGRTTELHEQKNSS
jgi:hypothetical protein